jgi:tetratricopeptide (TPR) repeat protein
VSSDACGQGTALLAGGRFHEALAQFAQALRQDPASLEARMGLARACAGTGDAVAAAAWFSDVCRIAPGEALPHQLLADLLLRQKLHAQALPIYARLCGEFGLRNRANLLHYGFAKEQTGDAEGAAGHYREALALDPDFMEAHVDLAGVLWRLEDFEGALAHAERAVQLAPDHAYAVRMLGTALLNLDRLPEAERHLRRALALQPGLVLAELDLAFTLLGAGRWEEGWSMYERRWRDVDRLRRPPFFRPDHEWRGPAEQPLRGRTLAVYAEQGLGDALQFLRYLPRLRAEGADVVCVLPAELVPLVEASFEGVRCLKPETQVRADLHAALLDLPLRFGTTLDNLPAQVPYLRAPASHAAHWRERLAPWAGQFKVGLAWSGSWVQVNNRNRAMPLSLLQPLMDLTGVQCFSLQKGDAGAATDTAPDARRLVDFTPDWADFCDSAAMMESLDLVITVDTAIAHLAGALARPVWVMLPPNADWRWLLDREDSPWYPTARLFRRDFGEARQAQVARVLQALQERLSLHDPGQTRPG